MNKLNLGLWFFSNNIIITMQNNDEFNYKFITIKKYLDWVKNYVSWCHTLNINCQLFFYSITSMILK